MNGAEWNRATQKLRRYSFCTSWNFHCSATLLLRLHHQDMPQHQLIGSSQKRMPRTGPTVLQTSFLHLCGQVRTCIACQAACSSRCQPTATPSRFGRSWWRVEKRPSKRLKLAAPSSQSSLAAALSTFVILKPEVYKQPQALKPSGRSFVRDSERHAPGH